MEKEFYSPHISAKLKNVKFNGRESLELDEIIDYSSKNRQEKHFLLPLKEVTVEELQEARKTKTPYFVLKEYGKYYLAEIQHDFVFVSSKVLGGHMCSYCDHVSAASDEDGGCVKVRQFSKCIERYPFILLGYETFNTVSNVFVVPQCTNYAPFPSRKTSHFYEE